MSIERVKAYFRQYGMEDKILEFDVSSATVELAAQALHCEPKRIAKTLSFKVGDGAILVVAAGDAKVNNGKYKAQFGTKSEDALSGRGGGDGRPRGGRRLSVWDQ